VVNARTFKERPVSDHKRLLVIHAQIQTFGWYQSAVRVQRERTQIVVAEIIGVRRYEDEKFRVLHHGK